MGLMSDLVEERGVLDAKRKELETVFNEAGKDIDMDKVKHFTGTTVEKAAAIRELHDEINERSVKVDELAATVKAMNAARAGEDDPANDPERDTKGFRHSDNESDPERDEHALRKLGGLGDMFVKGKGHLKQGSGDGPLVKMDVPHLKTLMTTAAGWAPESLRSGRVVDFATRPLQVADLIPQGNTGSANVVYMEETAVTNNAAETAEGGTYPESALQLQQKQSPVQKIATYIPVTDEQLEDVVGIQSYLNQRLTFMVKQRLDSQLIVGNGTPPNLRGILNVAGIQTTAKGTDPGPTAVYKAMVLVMTSGQANPSGVIFNPLDWQDIKTLTTADGIYIWGNPADVAPDRIWGLPVGLAQAMTQNTVIVGDFATHTSLVMRRDVQLQVSNSHSTFFIEGKQAVRADMRVAFVVYRPSAIVAITGM